VPWRFALLSPLLVAVLAAVLFVPYLRTERDVVVASPQPPPLFQAVSIQLAGGERACAAPVPLSRAADIARFVAQREPDAPATPLRVTVTAPGYTATRTFSDYADHEALDVPLPDPPRAEDGQLCVQDAGTGTARLVGSREPRTFGRLKTTVRGRPYDVNLVLSLHAREPASLWSRRAAIVRAAADIAPGFAPAWLLWIVGVLVVAGIPALVALALRLAPDDDQP
jgi:hypothetical protein